jgi:hypothetical protein
MDECMHGPRLYELGVADEREKLEVMTMEIEEKEGLLI